MSSSQLLASSAKCGLAGSALWPRGELATDSGTPSSANDVTTRNTGPSCDSNRDRTPEESLAYLRATHEAVMKRLSSLTDAELQLSYNHYQPNEPRDDSDDRPAVEWVAGNTWEHYAEHIAWIQRIVKDASASC